ncbi:hypothetical protein BRC19_02490 [Candidatus Saccharibacteria bacterium QS_5_54_17]|nr:MAG: hypothetical protein BRC19_02490 [Candidatus Saccharibacteria bacterium QS_5_54_17]
MIVILNLFQDLFLTHIGLIDSGSGSGMTKRVRKKKYPPEPVILNLFQDLLQTHIGLKDSEPSSE